MALIDSALLNSYLGKHIDDICPAKYAAKNHCAHFVGHVLQLRSGAHCSANPGASIRVQEIFHSCGHGVKLNSCDSSYPTGLLFVTHEENVNLSTMTMQNVPNKHIGIVFGQQVWHYSNSNHRVICQSVDSFIYHYPHQRNGLWLCPLPLTANAKMFGT